MKQRKANLLLLALGSLLFILLAIAAHVSQGKWFHAPYIAAWTLASLNFVLAVQSVLWARGLSLIRAMALILGGLTVRMIGFLSVVGAVFAFQKTWATAFALPLLGCFFVYFLAELILFVRPALAPASGARP